MPPPSEREQLIFLTNLQRLLSEGQFVATYKYALLTALTDIAVEHGDETGAPLSICTRHIAEKFIHYYWQQSAPYPVGTEKPEQRTGGAILRQNTGNQAAIVNYISTVRARYPTLSDIRRDARTWNQLVKQVDRVIRIMPLWKLQTVGHQSLDFLYENQMAGNTIELKPGIAFCLRRFYPLINDLVRGAWARYVRENNQQILATTADLSEFLFGSERSNLALMRTLLKDSQSGRCFYCRGPLSGVTHVDHFIPWARYRADLGHNFVLAHCSCNTSKGDKLAASEHLDRWVERNRLQRSYLAEEFDRRKILHSLEASERVVEWSYSQAAHAGAFAWSRGDILIPVSESWLDVLRVGPEG